MFKLTIGRFSLVVLTLPNGEHDSSIFERSCPVYISPTDERKAFDKLKNEAM